MEYSKTKVIGSALYFEFERALDWTTNSNLEVQQTLLTPQFILDRSRHIAIRTMERRVSRRSPRERWNIFRTAAVTVEEVDKFNQTYRDIIHKPNPEDDSTIMFNMVSQERSKEIAETLLAGFVKRDIYDFMEKGWTLVGRPFAVEVSELEAHQLRANSAPPTLYKRIERAKKALGYPDIKRIKDETATSE